MIQLSTVLDRIDKFRIDCFKRDLCVETVEAHVWHQLWLDAIKYGESDHERMQNALKRVKILKTRVDRLESDLSSAEWNLTKLSNAVLKANRKKKTTTRLDSLERVASLAKTFLANLQKSKCVPDNTMVGEPPESAASAS